VLSGRKGKIKGKDDGRVYDFNVEKLERIAKKYGCSLADKRTSETSCQGVSALKPENEIKEKNIDLDDEKIRKQEETPGEVVQLVRLSANYNFKELAAKAKEVVRLTTNFGVETCIACASKGCPDWQVTLFDDSWGFLCGPCGQKLSEKLSSHN
jgi:hypothetical protein